MFHQDIKVISELLLRNFLFMTQITNISKKSGNLNRGSTNVKKSKKPQELSVTAGGSAQCHSYVGRQFGGFSQN